MSGRLLTVIHLGQPPAGASSRSSWAPFLEFLGASGDEKFRASLGMPIFFMASLVPRLENIVAAAGGRQLGGSVVHGGPRRVGSIGQLERGWLAYKLTQPYG